MFLYIVSLLGVFLENSIFFSGEKVYFFAIPFFTYVLMKKQGESVLTLIMIPLFISLQGQMYGYFFAMFFLYTCICMFLFRQIECNRGSIFYITILELLFYSILQNEHWNLFYFLIHGCIFLMLNYIYLKRFCKD